MDRTRMKSNSLDTLSLWPTKIYQEELDATSLKIAKDLSKLEVPADVDFLKGLRVRRPWCTHDLLHTDPKWKSVADYIVVAGKSILDKEKIIYDDVYITSMWLNVSWQNHNHHAHTHANSLLSGCLYINTPTNSQGIVFWDPRYQAHVFKPKGGEWGEQWLIGPKEGLMLIWPSWLLHSTVSMVATELAEPRISLAFNLMIKSNIDHHSIRLNLK